jgi:hypothetical protein
MYTDQAIARHLSRWAILFCCFLLARNAWENASCLSLSLAHIHTLQDTAVQRVANARGIIFFLFLEGRHECGDHLAECITRVAVAHLRPRDASVLHGVAQLQFCAISCQSVRRQKGSTKLSDCHISYN